MAGPPSTPTTTRRHSNQRRPEGPSRHRGADGSARCVGGTGRLPIRPLNDTYTVPRTRGTALRVAQSSPLHE
eukprot:5465632-Prymnesium_polylepis.1